MDQAHSRPMRRLLIGFVATAVGLVTVLSPIQKTDAASNIDTAARYVLLIDDVKIASFKAVGGLESEVEVFDYVDDPNRTYRKLPGKQKPPTLVLKRGKNQSRALWSWHEDVINNGINAAKKNGSIILYNGNNKPIQKYNFENAWPAKVEIGALKAGSSEVLMETVTMVCENISRVEP